MTTKYPLKAKLRRAVRLARDLYTLLNDLRAYLRTDRPNILATAMVGAAFEVAGAVYSMMMEVQAYLDASPNKARRP